MALSPALNLRAQKIRPRSFVVPARYPRSFVDVERVNVCAIIPTYVPGELTVKLVEDLLRWNPKVAVYVVDDSTPTDRKEAIAILEKIAKISHQVSVLRTPVNALKAGALNYALKRIFAGAKDRMPDVVLTIDDDVVIAPTTVKNLVAELMSYEHLGAVCSQCRVFNKNKNILTRLQGLEYLGFNATRLADEGFLRGPLVMHGMLTAFRFYALKEVGGFAEGHLIEDYEVTTRLKDRGWSVKSVPHAAAWTVVPERLSHFWRQRTRWSYGGITVLARITHPSSVFQDLLGHTVFLVTIGMVLFLLFSKSGGYVPSRITEWIVVLSLLQLGVWYVFQLWLMRSYAEKDRYDWLIRITLVPEFIYSYVMTFALLGSYVFLLFNMGKNILASADGSVPARIFGIGARFFRACGYTEKRWGTRPLQT